MSEFRTCSRCGTPDLTDMCPTCTAAFEGRTPAEDMTAEQRCEELRTWRCVEIDFTLIHQRIEELVGRPVFTHELADFRYLEHEILTGSVPSLDGVLAKLPHGKPVIVVGPAADDNPSGDLEANQ